MRRFNFRLQKVLEVREREEQEASKTLAQAKQTTESARDKLRNLEQTLADAFKNLASLRKRDDLDADEQLGYERYILLVKERIAAQKTVIAELILIENQRRQELIEAARDLKAMENLRAQAKAEYDSDLLHAEQAEADDLSSSRDLFKKRAA